MAESIDVEAFHKAEAVYWRQRAELTEAMLEQVASAVTEARRSVIANCLPPEPPVGTTFNRKFDDGAAWTRRDDGWYCGAPDGDECRNCPCDWFEVVEQGGLRYSRKLP